MVLMCRNLAARIHPFGFNMPLINHYEVLQVSQNAEAEVIEAAFKRLSLKYHPDRCPDADAHGKMVQINLAYHHLRDALRRKEHDEELTKENHRARKARREAWEASKVKQREERARQAEENDKKARAEMEKARSKPSGWDEAGRPATPARDFSQKAVTPPVSQGSSGPRDSSKIDAKRPGPPEKTRETLTEEKKGKRQSMRSLAPELEAMLDRGCARNEAIKRLVHLGYTLEEASVMVGQIVDQRSTRGIPAPPLNPLGSGTVSNDWGRGKAGRAVWLGLGISFVVLVSGLCLWTFREKTGPNLTQETFETAYTDGGVSGGGTSQLSMFTDPTRARIIELFRTGKRQEALREFDQLLENDKDNSQTFELRGYFHGEMGQHQQAVADYTRAIELGQEKPALFLNRGINQMKIGHFREAIRDFSQVIALDPEESSAYLGRGICRSRLENHEDAVSDYSRFIQLRPQDAKGYLNRHFSLKRIGLTDQAEKDLQEALRLYPALNKK